MRNDPIIIAPSTNPAALQVAADQASIEAVIGPVELAPRAERQVTVLVNAAVAQGTHDGLCRIRNASVSGMAIETSLPMAVGVVATITLRSGRRIEGIIRWSRDNRAGMSCDEDVVAALRDERTGVEIEHPGPSVTRFVRNAAVELFLHGRGHRCTLHSLSLGDILLTDAPPLEKGQYLSIRIAGLNDCPAVVRVSDGDALLACFTPPLAFRAMEPWLAATTN